jgi:hypothetical protein
MTGFLALLIVILCVLTFFYPRSRDTPQSRKAVHLPLLIPVLYAPYEITMPAEANVRVDVFLLWPLMAIALIVYISRL